MNVLVSGGGNVGRQLARLFRDAGHKVSVIEKRADRVESGPDRQGRRDDLWGPAEITWSTHRQEKKKDPSICSHVSLDCAQKHQPRGSNDHRGFLAAFATYCPSLGSQPFISNTCWRL
ncbi:MAG TPA: hypothetical protein GXX30_10700 [Firmicutes bacterium]|nr:hypothetical protein [Candidatus Fermentithermobacillaceae bacterium]